MRIFLDNCLTEHNIEIRKETARAEGTLHKCSRIQCPEDNHFHFCQEKIDCLLQVLCQTQCLYPLMAHSIDQTGKLAKLC